MELLMAFSLYTITFPFARCARLERWALCAFYCENIHTSDNDESIALCKLFPFDRHKF